MVGQPLGRGADPVPLDVLGAVGVGRHRGDLFGVDGLPQLTDGVPVERCDPGDDLWIVEEQEPPVLGVASGGCADGGIEDPGLDVQRHRVGTDPAHRPGRVEGLLDVHADLPLVLRSRGDPIPPCRRERLARTGTQAVRARSFHRAGAMTPGVTPDVVELTVGAIAAGGGCVARAPDGRVVFVRHSLPGERVRARITSETGSFLRADAVEVLEASTERVAPPCAHAGPGRCGGCDFQHVALPAQRVLKEDLVAEQLSRLAGLELRVPVEEVPGAPAGLGWRTRVSFAVDREGRTGLHRHRSHDIEAVDRCPIATASVDSVGVGSVPWTGAGRIEVMASPDGGLPVVLVEAGKGGLRSDPAIAAGLVSGRRTLRAPDHVVFEVLGRRFTVHAGVFWQVHPGAATALTRAVLEGADVQSGERVADLYAGAGLFSVGLALAVGPTGSVTAVERSAAACADLRRNAAGLGQVEVVRGAVTGAVVARRLGRPDLVVLDPPRAGAGRPVIEALAGLDPAPRRIAYVSCEPAAFARDLRILLDAGWSLGALRAFDLFPMTEHVELVGIVQAPGRPAVSAPGRTVQI